MTYYVGVEMHTQLYIPHSISTDYQLTKSITNEWQTTTAMKNATKHGIEPNTDLKFYLGNVPVTVKKMSADEFKKLPSARHKILDHSTLLGLE